MSSRLEVLGLRASHEGIQSVKDNIEKVLTIYNINPPKEVLQDIAAPAAFFVFHHDCGFIEIVL